MIQRLCGMDLVCKLIRPDLASGGLAPEQLFEELAPGQFREHTAALP